MFEIITTIAFAFAAIISPIKPEANYVYTAKASSLNTAVLRVDKVPETPASKIAPEENEGKKIADFPEILNRVAFCESGGKHFDENGKVIRGKENSSDIGKYQINLFYHWETANKLGYDIFTEKGNENYALYLYKKNETRDWLASKNCWLQTSP